MLEHPHALAGLRIEGEPATQRHPRPLQERSLLHERSEVDFPAVVTAGGDEARPRSSRAGTANSVITGVNASTDYTKTMPPKRHSLDWF